MEKTYRILLVDDEPSIIKMVGKRLEIEGFVVTTAQNGMEALAQVRVDPPDLIVLDLMMPELDGFAVCEQLQQDARYKQIPVVVLTAKTSDSDEQRARAYGVKGFVRKPFHAEELISAIRGQLFPEQDR